MANDTNFGAEKLTSRIVEEAEAEAGRIIMEAEAKAGAISSQAEAEAERLNIEYAKKAEKAAADIIERSRTNGALDSRKTALREKRRVLDAAFDLAEKELCALEGEKREGVVRGYSTSARHACLSPFRISLSYPPVLRVNTA